MTENTIISKDREFSVELIHRDSDPGSWIVRRWRRVLWFRKQISSDWFNDKHQAISFASGPQGTSLDTRHGRPEGHVLIRSDARVSADPQQAGDEGRWQDDGGESG